MKVLHVVPALAARYGGPSEAVVRMARALIDRGVDVELCSTDADGRGRLPVPLGLATSHEQVPTRFFARQWSEAFKLSLPLARWLGEEVQRFDVVHVHAVFSHASLAAMHACARARVPYVVRPLGSLDVENVRARRRLLKGALWHALLGRLIRGAAAVQFTTEEERRTSSHGLTNGVVIPLGVDLAPEAVLERSREQRPFVLFLGRLHPIKRVDLLLDAFLPLQGTWQLVIAGSGEATYEAELRARAANHPGGHRVEWLGWIGPEQKEDLLRRAALLVQPSARESFGLSVIEAMAHGIPVIVTRGVALAGEVERAGAGWVTPESVDGLAGTLRSALAAPTERAARGRRGWELVRRDYAWSAVAERLVELYSRSLDPNRAR